MKYIYEVFSLYTLSWIKYILTSILISHTENIWCDVQEFDRRRWERERETLCLSCLTRNWQNIVCYEALWAKALRVQWKLVNRRLSSAPSHSSDSHRLQFQIDFGASHFLIYLKAAKTKRTLLVLKSWQQKKNSNNNNIKILLNSCFSH